MTKLEITGDGDFRCYPDGANERIFKPGQIVEDLPEAFAAVLVDKGLAKVAGAPVAAIEAPAEASPAAPALPPETSTSTPVPPDAADPVM